MTIDLVYLQLQAAKGIGPVKQHELLQLSIDSKMPLDELILRTSSETLLMAGFTPKQVESLKTAREQANNWASNLREKKISVIGFFDAEYPVGLKQVLGSKAPPILAVWGNLNLLQKPAIGFCGARNASDQGIEFTKDAAGQVAQQEVVVIAGNARGIDAAAHLAALQSGGNTIIVAPSGILDVRLRESYRDIVTPENTLVISEFQPNAHWSISNAMTRNRTICGLSQAMIVVEAGLSGGTYEAGKFALGAGVKLFVADYAFPAISAEGNRYFLEKGAVPIRKNRHPGQANMTEVMKELGSQSHDRQKPPIPPITRPIQGKLF